MYRTHRHRVQVRLHTIIGGIRKCGGTTGLSEPKQSAGGAKPGRGPKGPRSEARGLQTQFQQGAGAAGQARHAVELQKPKNKKAH